MTNQQHAEIIEESIHSIDSAIDGEYVIGQTGLANALNDLRRTAAALRAPQGETCNWTLVGEENEWFDIEGPSWTSACGERWLFNDGGPSENKVRFCQGCGRRVVVVSSPVSPATEPQEATDYGVGTEPRPVCMYRGCEVSPEPGSKFCAFHPFIPNPELHH